MYPETLTSKTERLIIRLTKQSLQITVAESCTGGLLGGLITSVSGSSDVFKQGFITYSNEAKERLIGVDAELLRAHGAVSEEVAGAMAEGVLHASAANIGLAITGIAGPGGGTEEKPVGLVYVACAYSITPPACGGVRERSSRTGGEPPSEQSIDGSISAAMPPPNPPRKRGGNVLVPPGVGGIIVRKNLFGGDRIGVRLYSCEKAIDMALECLD